MSNRFPHGGEVLGATPAHPLLVPALSAAPGLSLSRQQALLDQQAITRIPGLAGYWPADPAYLFEDSAGTIQASVNGVVGCVRNVLAAPVYTPVTVANPNFTDGSAWTTGTDWVIGSGVATKTAGTASVLSQAVSLVAGTTYLLTWTMTRSAGTLTPRFTGGTTNTGTGMVLSGAYEENFVATTGNAVLEFSADASFAGTVDNVTLVSVSNSPALQATTAVKPYLRKTPTSGVYWIDSNTATSALTATLGNLGSACTVCRAGAEGVTFTEGVTISSTYNLAPAFGFNADIAIFNRALTATEKALITRYMQRSVPVLSPEKLVNNEFTLWSGNTPTGWTKNPSENATNYVYDAGGGAGLVCDYTTISIYLFQTMPSGSYLIRATARSNAGNPLKMQISPAEVDLSIPGYPYTLVRHMGTSFNVDIRRNTTCDSILESASSREIL